MKEERVFRTVKLVVVAALIAAMVTTLGCTSGTTVTTATATKKSLSVTVSASGKISAGDRVDVYPPTTGTLSNVYVKDAQTVKAGQRLAKMDTGPLRPR